MAGGDVGEGDGVVVNEVVNLAEDYFERTHDDYMEAW